MHVATPEPGQADANLVHEDHVPTGGPTPAAIGDHPTSDALPSHYEVMHAAVGGHYKGERVEAGTFTDEQSRRLLRAGAIHPIYEAD